jgi:hypothetical protein
MLDWTKIDDPKTFQKLVNDIFAWEIDKPDFKPGNAYIGADGGWDGRYVGEYLCTAGTFLFQAKWTGKLDLTEAYKSIKAVLPEELGKAKDLSVDHVILATNARLQIGSHIPELEALNKGHVKTLFVYDQTKLEQLIEKYPWIKYRYFNQAAEPLFSPAKNYFHKSERELFITSDLYGFTAELMQFNDFLESNERIAVISSPGGFGKSRFIKEIAQSIVSTSNGKWIPLFGRVGLRPLDSALSEELLSNKKYILFIDNIDLYPENIADILKASKHLSEDRIRIVLTSRTENLESLHKEIERLRISDAINIKLKELLIEEQVHILKEVSGKKVSEETKKVLKGLGNNLHQIVEYGKLLSGNNDVKAEDINKSIVLEQVRKGDILLKEGFKENEINLLLTFLAANIPFKISDGESLNLLAKQVGKSEKQTEEAINLLKENGLLRLIGKSFRFATDMKGNILLSELVTIGNYDLGLFHEWMRIDSKQLSYNLGIAYVHSHSSELLSVTKSLVDSLISDLNAAEEGISTKGIDWLANFAHVVPEEVLTALYIITDKVSGVLDRDDIGSILNNLVLQPVFYKETLELIKSINNKKTEGRYNNYEPKELIGDAVSPIKNRNVDNAIQNLLVLQEWVESADFDMKTLELVLSALEEALSGSHSYSHSEGMTITYGQKSLIYGPKVEEYRSSAMLIVRKIFGRSEPDLKAKAVRLLSKIGEDCPSKEGPLWTRIVEDKLVFLKLIETEINRKNPDVRVLAEAEDKLLLLWGNVDHYPELESKTLELLTAIPKSPELQIFKLMSKSDFVIESNSELISSAPSSEIWSWLVHNHMYGLNSSVDTSLLKSVRDLSEKYVKPEEILSFLKDLDEKINEPHWDNVPLIETWFTNTKDSLIKILSDESMIKQVPLRFIQGFQIVGSKNIPKYLDDYASMILKKESITQLEIDRLLDMIQVSDKDADVYTLWLTGLEGKLDARGKGVLFNRLPRMYEEHSTAKKQDMLSILTGILKSDKTGELARHSGFAVHLIEKYSDYRGLDVASFKESLFNNLVSTPRFDYHAKTTAYYVLGNDVESLIKLLEKRLKYKYSVTHSYSALPFDGFDRLADYINEYNKYSIFMDKVHEWLGSSLIYSFQIDSLTKHLNSIKNNDGETYAETYLKEKLSSGNALDLGLAITCLNSIDFGLDTYELFADALVKAGGTDLYESAKNALVHSVLSGSFSGAVGEAPQEWLNKKKVLEQVVAAVAPGKIKVLFQSLLNQVNHNIKSHLEDDEEMLDSKD